MSPRRARALSFVVIIAAALPATAHAVHTRTEQRRTERDLFRLTAAIEPLATVGDGVRRVTLNGAPMMFQTSTEARSLDDVMAGVARDCGSGDRDLALGEPMGALADGPQSARIRLERIVTQEATSGERASLCIFEPDEREAPPSATSPAREPLPRVRYTLAHRVDDATTSVTTVVSPSATALAALFPAEGDAPGSDLPSVARPANARRTLTAIVGADNHSVRIYESSLSTEAAVASYDAAMTGLGYATTASLIDARMYRRDGRSFVASFRATTEGCDITIAPFERGADARPPVPARAPSSL